MNTLKRIGLVTISIVLVVAVSMSFAADMQAASSLKSPIGTPPPEAELKHTPTPIIQQTPQLPQPQQHPFVYNSSGQNVDPVERAFYEGMLAMCKLQGIECSEAVQQAKLKDWYRHWEQ